MNMSSLPLDTISFHNYFVLAGIGYCLHTLVCFGNNFTLKNICAWRQKAAFAFVMIAIIQACKWKQLLISKTDGFSLKKHALSSSAIYNTDFALRAGAAPWTVMFAKETKNYYQKSSHLYQPDWTNSYLQTCNFMK